MDGQTDHYMVPLRELLDLDVAGWKSRGWVLRANVKWVRVWDDTSRIVEAKPAWYAFRTRLALALWVRREYLLTRAEARFYREVLKPAADAYGLAVMFQASVRAFTRSDSAQNFDFTLLRKAGRRLTLVAAVELDDPSHLKPEAAERDRRKDDLCVRYGINLLRVNRKEGGFGRADDTERLRRWLGAVVDGVFTGGVREI